MDVFDSDEDDPPAEGAATVGSAEAKLAVYVIPIPEELVQDEGIGAADPDVNVTAAHCNIH